MAHTLDAYASEPHYLRHLRPILAALPHDARGTLYVPQRLIDRVTGLGWHVVGRRPAPVPESPTPRPILVASFQDARTARPRGYVLADHGAGQSYAGEPRTARHPSYSGGDEHERCLLFLCPNDAVAGRWQAAYPDTLAAVVGYPALDRAHSALDWWHEYVFRGGVHPTSETAGVVLEALLKMASVRLAVDRPERSRPLDSGEVLGLCGGERARRVLALAGVSDAEWQRAVQVRWSDATGAPGGVASDPRSLARGDDRSHLSQQFGLPGRDDLSSPGVCESGSSRSGGHRGEREAFAEHQDRTEHQEDPLQVRPSVLTGEHVVRQDGPTSLPGVPPAIESGVVRSTWPLASAQEKPVVAVSFHANIGLCPETKSAWPHYNAVLPALARDPRWHLLGHGHPRLYGRIERRWRELGVEHTPDFDEVLARASCFVVDNSSTGIEFMSLDRPIVWLSAPWYRREVHHGGRFWDWVDGAVHCEESAALPDAIALALTDPPEVAERRREIVEQVMPLRDGRGAQRAVEAICGVLNGSLVA